MADNRDDDSFYLVDPPNRAILPLDRFHMSSRLARTVRSTPFEVRVDTAFSQMIALCAEAARDRPETWISYPIEALYTELFAGGLAHSIEVWHDDRLVGGLYGVTLGGAFFGESMVSRQRDASKIALSHLVARLIRGGYTLLDCQFMTAHLSQFGVTEIVRTEYQLRLQNALSVTGNFMALPLTVSGTEIAAIIQAAGRNIN